MYIIGINTTGATPVDCYSGASMVADLYGNIIQHAGKAEQLVFTDLDSRVVADARRSLPVALDRKDKLYRELRGSDGGDQQNYNR